MFFISILELEASYIHLQITTLTAAFNLFKKPKEDSLSETEAAAAIPKVNDRWGISVVSSCLPWLIHSAKVRTMLDYLGFPKDLNSQHGQHQT